MRYLGQRQTEIGALNASFEPIRARLDGKADPLTSSRLPKIRLYVPDDFLMHSSSNSPPAQDKLGPCLMHGSGKTPPDQVNPEHGKTARSEHIHVQRRHGSLESCMQQAISMAGFGSEFAQLPEEAKRDVLQRLRLGMMSRIQETLQAHVAFEPACNNPMNMKDVAEPGQGSQFRPGKVSSQTTAPPCHNSMNMKDVGEPGLSTPLRPGRVSPQTTVSNMIRAMKMKDVGEPGQSPQFRPGKLSSQITAPACHNVMNMADVGEPGLSTQLWPGKVSSQTTSRACHNPMNMKDVGEPGQSTQLMPGKVSSQTIAPACHNSLNMKDVGEPGQSTQLRPGKVSAQPNISNIIRAMKMKDAGELGQSTQSRPGKASSQTTASNVIRAATCPDLTVCQERFGNQQQHLKQDTSPQETAVKRYPLGTGACVAAILAERSPLEQKVARDGTPQRNGRQLAYRLPWQHQQAIQDEQVPQAYAQQVPQAHSQRARTWSDFAQVVPQSTAQGSELNRGMQGKGGFPRVGSDMNMSSASTPTTQAISTDSLPWFGTMSMESLPHMAVQSRTMSMDSLPHMAVKSHDSLPHVAVNTMDSLPDIAESSAEDAEDYLAAFAGTSHISQQTTRRLVQQHWQRDSYGTSYPKSPEVNQNMFGIGCLETADDHFSAPAGLSLPPGLPPPPLQLGLTSEGDLVLSL